MAAEKETVMTARDLAIGYRRGKKPNVQYLRI